VLRERTSHGEQVFEAAEAFGRLTRPCPLISGIRTCKSIDDVVRLELWCVWSCFRECGLAEGARCSWLVTLPNYRFRFRELILVYVIGR
jgi:hypothetical protein